jgi:hypothetical protein
MKGSRTQVAIAVGAGALLVLIFLGYLNWLNNQGPVLSRSVEKDPLSGIPLSISLNPFRDRSSERVAAQFIRAMRDGKCRDELSDWLHDYRKKYASFLCDSEAEHPLLSWKIAEWEDRPPLRILQYWGTRRGSPGQKPSDRELFSVTLERKDGAWVVTKYDALY